MSNKKHGKLTVIVGAMKSSKSGTMNALIQRSLIAKRQIKVFTPSSNTRDEECTIVSRNGTKSSAIKVNQPYDVLAHVGQDDKVVFIDEVQLWEENLEHVILDLLSNGKDVVLAGLDLDFRNEPFDLVGRLLSRADEVVKLTSVCDNCGSDFGRRTVRFTNNKPSRLNESIFIIEGSDSEVEYYSYCSSCYQELYQDLEG